MADQGELEALVRQLQTDLDDSERRNEALSQELADTRAESTALEVEVDVYRNRYDRILRRLDAGSAAVKVADAARQYINALDHDSSVGDDVAFHLTILATQVHDCARELPSPELDHILDLEGELATLRTRVGRLQRACADANARIEVLEGNAADWQELAEVSDRALVAAQRRISELIDQKGRDD